MDNKSCIQFLIDKPASQRIRLWQEKSDWEFMRKYLEGNGRVMVTSYQGKTGLRQLQFLPAQGEAVPYYGNIGGAYRFRFTPLQPGDYHLVVLNTGYSVLPGEQIPKYETDLFQILHWLVPSAEISLKKALISSEIDQDKPQIEFTTWPEMVKKLKSWRWWGEPATAYTWEFQPTSIGIACLVIHHPGGEIIDLTGFEDF